MPEFPPTEDQAALYVMGGLTTDERREFKVRLAESAELRALVRELEEGAVALALAAPRRLPPQKIWRQIERAVAGENRRTILTPLFSGGWWRNGWAAAAACLVGWLFYACWPIHPTTTAAPPALAETGNHTQAEIASASPAPSKTTEPNPAKPADVAAARRMLQDSVREIGGLRAQIAALESNDARLTQSVGQLQALLGESNRLKFVQFKPTASGDSPAPAVNLSPDLQRALALAMARELGWAQSDDPSAGTESNSPGGQSLVTISNVDFVDLRPGTNGSSSSVPSPPSPQPPLQPRPQTDDQTALVSAPPTPTEPSPASIPAFISGQNLIVAIDSTIAAKDSHVSFSYQTPDQGQVSLGTANVGANPIVITVPMNLGGSSPTGWSTPITANISSGGFTTTQTFTPQTPSP